MRPGQPFGFSCHAATRPDEYAGRQDASEQVIASGGWCTKILSCGVSEHLSMPRVGEVLQGDITLAMVKSHRPISIQPPAQQKNGSEGSLCYQLKSAKPHGLWIYAV